MSEYKIKYNAWFKSERLGTFETLKEAREIIYKHENFFKTKFTKRGEPRSNNITKDYFRIYDSFDGTGWSIY